MSLVPLFYRDWWDEEDLFKPSRLFDTQFGTGLRRDDLLNSLSSLSIQPRNSFRNYLRPSPLLSTALQRQNSGSTITTDQDKFQVILDVQQFTPNEITVKTSGRSIVVEGKHEEKQDEHGFISRHFVRRYLLPEGYNVEDVISTLSSDGVLTVTTPKKSIQTSTGEKVVPIKLTGPTKATVEPVPETPATTSA